MARFLLSQVVQSSFAACRSGCGPQGLEKPAPVDVNRLPWTLNDLPAQRAGTYFLESLQDFGVLRLKAPIHGDILGGVFTNKN
jgi:hypothetical protein